jgi:hypothetical protein
MTTEFGMEPMLGGCKLGKKDSCWECYKLEVSDEMMQLKEVPNKLFCSHKWVDKFKSDNFIKWALESCLNRFPKTRGGTIVGSNWYCSQDCAQKDNPEVDEAYEDEGDLEEINEQNEDDQNEDNQNEEIKTQY